MKEKFATLFIAMLFIAVSGFCQDSVRTRNDKPGTPQSLRTIDNSPVNQVHVTNKNQTIPNQSINHGATESNDVNNNNNSSNSSNNNINNNNQTIITDPNPGSGATVPRTPVTIANKSLAPANRADSISNNGTMTNGQSNATNPIRK